MIRVRDTKGKYIETSHPILFVEVCDADGDVGLVLLKDETTGGIVTLKPGTAEMKNYCSLFGTSSSGGTIRKTLKNG